MNVCGSAGRCLGAIIAVCAFGCKQDLATGRGGTGGQFGTTGAGGAVSSTGGRSMGGGGDAGYGGGTGGVGTGGVGGAGGLAGAGGHPISAVPPLHRPTAAVCSDAGGPLSGYDGGTRFPVADGGDIRCTTDSMCPACSNGLPDRCVSVAVLINGGVGGAAGSLCACDQCTGDQDCGSKGVCACGTLGGNICLPGNCRVDSDCGPGGYCSPSSPRACGTGDLGYYCHTAQDQCRADADCSGLGYSPYCAYSIEAAIWTCAMGRCAG